MFSRGQSHSWAKKSPKCLEMCSTSAQVRSLKQHNQGFPLPTAEKSLKTRLWQWPKCQKFSLFYGILLLRTRDESLTVIKLKGLTPNGTLPAGLLSGGRKSLLDAMDALAKGGESPENFDRARQLDLINERMPPLNSSSIYESGGAPE
ncbi:Serine/threonine-protein phosphatase 2B catalytic subunit gamma isoform [Thelohanellus kitauei]|uniref:Serine/threonine-protein phosphatase 2B catalytic subunit gamma isoform n=1 Tax=Thelohanellus kitauei TaxID=669202 RepID=A0A0C2MRG1_THEKT|nr:Serine/threonine-protein phosphatase 2B catalytic subunit gamma isoform [Thelohanellus kitauei]